MAGSGVALPAASNTLDRQLMATEDTADEEWLRLEMADSLSGQEGFLFGQGFLDLLARYDGPACGSNGAPSRRFRLRRDE